MSSQYRVSLGFPKAKTPQVLAILILAALSFTASISTLCLNLGSIELMRYSHGRMDSSDAAEKLLNLSLKWNPENHRASRQMGLLYWSRCDYDSVVNILGKIPESRLDNSASEILGDSYVSLGEWDKAASAWIRAGVEKYFIYRGDWQKVVLIYEFKLRENPNSLEANTGLGFAWLEQGQAEKALAPLRKGVALDPTGLRVRFGLAQVENALGYWYEASRDFIELIRMVETGTYRDDGSSPRYREDVYHESLAMLAYIYKTNGFMDLAEQYYRQIKSLWPSDLTPYGHLADIYLSRNQPDRALQELEPIIEAGRVSDFAFRAGRAYLMMGYPEKAYVYLKQAVDIEPNKAEFHAQLAESLCQLGEKEEADWEYSQAHNLGWKGDILSCK